MSKWTDEQAADAAIALLKPPHEITVMQSWFKPVPSAFGGHEAGPGRWVPVKEHADIVLTLGRRILDLEAELEQDEPLRAKMADLLTRTAIALKGEPGKARCAVFDLLHGASSGCRPMLPRLA